MLSVDVTEARNDQAGISVHSQYGHGRTTVHNNYVLRKNENTGLDDFAETYNTLNTCNEQTTGTLVSGKN